MVTPLDSTIIVALITGGVTLIGTIFTVLGANKKQAANTQKNQAVMTEQIKELTREVRVHNGFAERIPAIEAELRQTEHRLDEIERRRDNE